MSQIFKPLTSAGPIPPIIPTEFDTDNGTAIPPLNILNVNGVDSSVNNDNGIFTQANPDLSNNLEIVLSNRITGAITTTDDAVHTLVSVSLGATPGVYLVQGDITAFDVTDNAGASYFLSGAAITDGVTGTEIASEEKQIFEQAAMSAADFDYAVVGNNAIVEVTGIAGKTINWSCLFTYRFVG